MREGVSFILISVLLSCLGGCSPNLVVEHVDANWNDGNQRASAEIANTGNRAAGNFMVYFNADEDPVSPNRRPQVRHDVSGLAPGDSIILESDFAPLAHPDNDNLGNVYRITVTADPKNTVDESRENDNTGDALVGCPVANSNVATGTTGTLRYNQTFNETRAVRVTVISATDRITESLTLDGLNLYTADTALLGVRIYDNTTQALVASSDITVAGGSSSTSATVPISATLLSGQSYRIGFYVDTDPVGLASGNFFQPDSFADLYNPVAYTETTGIFRIDSAHATGSDSFPVTPNLYVPQMTISTRCRL